MVVALEAEKTDELINACLFCDVQSLAAAIKKGACVNRANHLGLFPVHVLVDPGNNTNDSAQASCLSLLLSHGVDIYKKHRNTYTLCERISTFLPLCGLAVIEHLKSLPCDYDDLEKEQQHWWDDLFGQWKSSQEAENLQEHTKLVQSDAGKSRL